MALIAFNSRASFVLLDDWRFLGSRGIFRGSVGRLVGEGVGRPTVHEPSQVRHEEGVLDIRKSRESRDFRV